MQVKVREVVGTVRAVEGESLLAPHVLEQIVSVVLEAMNASRADNTSRARDTRIGGGAGCGGDGHCGESQ